MYEQVYYFLFLFNRSDLYVPNFEDRYKSAGDYQSYDELFEIYDRAARIIQRNYRAYLLKKRIQECAAEYRRMLEECTKLCQEKKNLSRFDVQFHTDHFMILDSLLILHFDRVWKI